MLIEVTKKRFFGIVGFILLIAGILSVIAYNSSPANPAVFGHSANELEVNINGTVMTLQQAISSGALSGVTNSGSVGPLVQVYATPGTYTYPVPSGVTRLKVRLVGGVSAGTDAYSGAKPAVSGGYVEGFITNPSSSYTLIVGAGGQLDARTDVGAQQALANGGGSSFGSVFSAGGGQWSGTPGTATGEYVTLAGYSGLLVTPARGANGMIIIES